MDSRQCLIIDLKNKDSGQMFITEQIASIKHDARGYVLLYFTTSLPLSSGAPGLLE